MNNSKICALMIGMMIAGNIQLEAQQDIRVDVYPRTSRAIDGNLRLDRTKYFNLAASGTNIEGVIGDQAKVDYYFKDLKMTLGRALGMVGSEVSWGNSVFEDPARPGYTDLTRLRNQLNPTNSGVSADLKSILGANQDVAFHDRENSYPSFMPKYTKEGSDESFPINNDAASELAATLLEYKFTDFTRPAFYEPVNEPDWRFWSDSRFVEHHTSIHQKVHDAQLPVEVGGPCLSVGYLYKNKFDALSQITGFIDRSGGVLDFYSFHIYDYMKWSDEAFDFTGSVSSGLPVEGVFDALANHMHNKFGKPFTYVASEHGGYISDPLNREYAQNKLAELYFPGSGFMHTMEKRSISDFLAVSSEVANTFTFMNNPHVVKKAVPFILLESFNWDPDYYASLLVANNFTDNSNWVESKRIHFYELFRDVEGRRIRSFCDDADIQHHAFVEENKLILLFHNLSNAPGSIDLQIHDHIAGIKGITVRKYGRLPDFRPYLTEERLFSLEEDLPIAAREAIVLFIEYDAPIPENHILNEIPHYGNSTSIQFSGSFNFQVPMPDFEQAEYAILRVGIGLEPTVSKKVNISFNGTPLEVKTEDAQDILSGGDAYGSTRIVKVDTSLLQSDNTVSISFPDGQNGGVGATVIRAAYPSSDTIEQLEIIQPSLSLYENQTKALFVNILPETSSQTELTWSSSDPGIASVSPDGEVQGKAEGSTVIIARSIYGDYTDSCLVEVRSQQLLARADKSGWTAIYADDEGEIGGTLKELAIDDDPSTYWHTEWQTQPWKPLPHEIWVDMEDTLTFEQFIYTPRQDQWGPNGNIGDYELYFSNDTSNWGVAGASGSFTWNIGVENYYKEIQTIDLNTPVTARFFRLVALTEHQDSHITHTNAAELDVAADIAGVIFALDTLHISVGEQFTISAFSLPFSGLLNGGQLNWRSENLTVAAVSDGLVKGEGPGTTEIIVSTFSGLYSDTLVVNVSVIPVTDLKITPDELNIRQDEVRILHAEIQPANAFYDSYSWYSDNESAATVQMGYVTAIDTGTARIIVKSSDGIHRDTCMVHVIDSRYEVEFSLTDRQSDLPLQGAVVELGELSSETDESGKVSFSDVQYGSHDLLISGEKYQAFESTLTLSQDTLIALALDRTQRQVEFQLNELASGHPIPNVDVNLGTLSGRTDANGKLRISAYWGDLDYLCSKTYFLKSSGIVTINADTLITIELERLFADLKFKVTDSSGILQDVSILLPEQSGTTNAVGIYTFMGLEVNTNYSYQVSKPGYHPESDEVLLITDSTISINLSLITGTHDGVRDAVTVYPNPANKKFILNNPTEAQIQLVSLEGVILMDQTVQPGENTISVVPFESGIYLLRIISGGGMEVKSLSIIH